MDSQVFPTPDGPAKMNDPPGRLGSFRPARVRRIARLSALTASSWPMTRLCSSSSILSSRVDSSSDSFTIGMPVATASTSAISSSSTSATSSMSPARHCFSRSAFAQDELLLLVAQAGGGLEVLPVDRGLLALPHVGDLLVVLPQVGGRRHPADPQPRAGLVDQVDGLVGQEPVGDVAVGQRRRRDQRLVGDRHPVVRLVAVAQPLEHLDRVRDRRLGDLDRLEAALERGVLLEVLAVLVERGRADGLQLAAGQHRLEDRLAASIAPSAAPAPTRVWISSMNSTMSPRVRISLSTFFSRSSKSPR